MDFEPTEYVRKSFNVKAEEVTYENIEAVAEWCKGRVDSESTKILGGNEVKLPVVILAGQGEDKGKEIVARLGYFVVYSKGRFRVYKAPQFHASFEKQVDVKGKDVFVETTIEKCGDGVIVTDSSEGIEISA